MLTIIELSTGKKVSEQSGIVSDPALFINTNSLVSGLYIFKVSSADGQQWMSHVSVQH